MDKTSFSECKCLPGKERDAICFALEEKAFYYEERSKEMRERIKTYPEMARRSDELISENPQYQRGEATARDIGTDYLTSNIIAAELEDKGQYFRELGRILRSIPYCEWT